jgi:NADPH:quinone reductase-like Zn-dependent oxidoreductase
MSFAGPQDTSAKKCSIFSEVSLVHATPTGAPLLRTAGADRVFIDDELIAPRVKNVAGGGVDEMLELVGTTTLTDSLNCVREPGIVCMTGMVGNKWWFENFSPMDVIPTPVNLTTYTGGPQDFMRTPLQDLVAKVESGTLQVHVGKVFHLDEIAEAHRCMEENTAGGKIVVLTS